MAVLLFALLLEPLAFLVGLERVRKGHQGCMEESASFVAGVGVARCSGFGAVPLHRVSPWSSRTLLRCFQSCFSILSVGHAASPHVFPAPLPFRCCGCVFQAGHRSGRDPISRTLGIT